MSNMNMTYDDIPFTCYRGQTTQITIYFVTSYINKKLQISHHKLTSDILSIFVRYKQKIIKYVTSHCILQQIGKVRVAKVQQQNLD